VFQAVRHCGRRVIICTDDQARARQQLLQASEKSIETRLCNSGHIPVAHYPLATMIRQEISMVSDMKRATKKR
jgi:hypothetical protein